MGNNTTAATEANFEVEVLQSTVPVLVDFWAAWCGPCRAVAPTVEALATDYAGKLKVVKVDTEEAPELAIRYNVTSIPALILFKGGKVVERVIGNLPKAMLVSKFQPHL